MATSSLNSIRVRLYFDYPPPSTPDCRMCWLLVDLNKCRVVADLSSNIKEKFGYSRKTVLDLFIDECFLPSTESIYLIRDNDTISIKSSSLIYINGNEACLDSPVTKSKKREREDKTEVPQNPTKKKKLKDTQNGDSALVVDHKINHKKKKKKDRKESVTKSDTPQKTSPVKVKANTSRNKTSPKNTCSNTNKTTVKSPESTSGSSESSEDESQRKAPSKPKPKQSSANKKPSAAQKESSSSDSSLSDSKPAPRKNSVTSQPQPSSSSTPSLSSASSQSQVKPLDKKSNPASSSTQDKKAETSDSDSSDIKLVIKKPNLDGFGLKIAGLNSSQRARGNARGRGRGANRGGFDRAKGTPWKQQFQYSYENDEEQRQPDTLTNQSLILQNPPEPIQKRDYSTLPLLAAPPAVGQSIAFKLLELTENYTPEVSEYKEGKIKAYNPYTNVLELELLSQPQAPTEPGKFDLVYQNADGSEVVEYAVTHGSQVTERWDALLEPRLIVDHMG